MTNKLFAAMSVSVLVLSILAFGVYEYREYQIADAIVEYNHPNSDQDRIKAMNKLIFWHVEIVKAK